MITFNWYTFSELNSDQVYAMLALRSQTFVVEQLCPYLDPDGKDFFALHLLGMEENSLVAYIRLFPPTHLEKNLVFGRVVIAKSTRNKGHGKKLMQAMLDYCSAKFPGIGIRCSAQHYLQKFYEAFQFKAYGNVYDEDGIPHIEMQRE